MRKNQVSLTAIMCAYLRHCHAEYENPKIFDDFLAGQMIPPKNRILIEQGMTALYQLQLASSPHYNQKQALQEASRSLNSQSNLLSRARYTESLLEEEIMKNQITQYVILGAGLDTFPFRRPDLIPELHVFELDHPATQKFKKSRLTELNWSIPDHLHFISIDFEQDTLISRLKKTVYNPKAKSCFSWLGVTMYLHHSQISAILSSIAQLSSPGSILVFDYFDQEMFSPQPASKEIQQSFAMTQKAGEEIRTGFSADMIANELANAGFILEEDLGPSEILDRYAHSHPYGHLVKARVR